MRRSSVTKSILVTVICMSLILSSGITILAYEGDNTDLAESSSTSSEIEESNEIEEPEAVSEVKEADETNVISETEASEESETSEATEATVNDSEGISAESNYDETTESEDTTVVEEEEMINDQAFDAGPELSVNATEVTIYELPDYAANLLTIPSNYPTSFKLVVSNAKGPVKYKFRNYSCSVTVKDGTICSDLSDFTDYLPDGTEVNGYICEFGSDILEVSDGYTTKYVKVNLVSYARVYYEQTLKTFVKNNIKSTMSDYQKLETITKYAASFDYSMQNPSGEGMIILGYGSCWASVDVIVDLCKLVGIKAQGRCCAYEQGGNSAHFCVIAIIDGEFYTADVGGGKGPRVYWIEKANEFSHRGADLYQYDGFDSVVNIPSVIGSTTITSLGKDGAAILQNNDNVNNIKIVNIPSTIELISFSAFIGARGVTSYNVDKNNKAYKSVNGSIYTKDGTVLVAIPGTLTSFNIPSGVREVQDFLFYNNGNITSITIPNTVTTLGIQSFAHCSDVKRIVIPDSVKNIGYGCFNNNYFDVVILSKNAVFEEDVFWNFYGKIIGYRGSTAETYAKKNGNTFVAIDSNGQYILTSNGVSTLYSISGDIVDYTGKYTYEGKTYFIKNGKTCNDTTLVKIDGVWRYVEHGQFSNATTLVKYSNSWWYVKDGKLCYDETLVKYNNGWWYVKDGKICKDETLVKYNNAWWYVKDGKLCKDETLVKYNNAWWYVKDGKLCKTENFVKYSNSYWYCRDGKMQSSISGKITINGVTKTISKGKVVG